MAKIKIERSECKSATIRISCGSWALRCDDDAGGTWELRYAGDVVAKGIYSWALAELRDVIDIGAIHYREMTDGDK